MLVTVGVDGIAQQVKQHLFEQHPVGIHRWQPLVHTLLDAHLIAAGLPVAQAYRFSHDIGNRQGLQASRFLAQKGAQALDHFSGMGRLFIDALQALGDALRGLRIALHGLQVTLAGTGIVDHRRQRLVDFMSNPRGQLAQGNQPGAVGQFVLMAALLAFAQFTLGHVAGHQRVVALTTGSAMGQQHQRYRKRRAALVRDQPRLGLPHAVLLGTLPAFAVQALLQLRVEQGVQPGQRLYPLQPQGPPRRAVEVAEPAVAVAEQHQVGVGFDHLGQAPAVFLGFDTDTDVPRDADNLHHGTGIGFADGAAGDLEPQVTPVTVPHPAGHGLVAVLLQRLGRLQQRLLAILGMEQRLHLHPAQFFRPVAQQAERGGRGIDKTAVRRVPGNQVGGVLGDQPVQAPGLAGVTFTLALQGGITTTRQHLLGGVIGDEGPEQDLPGHRRLDLIDRPPLLQAGAHQCPVVARQPVLDVTLRPGPEQRLQGRVAGQYAG
ncbi:hypothetical protein D3C79_656760 [compost metagenome]